MRLEIPPTRVRGEAAYVAPQFPLARGWLRQAEADDFDLFTDDRLTPISYRRWLDENGVSYVALPDAELDYLADDEAELIRSGLSYLRPVWSNDDWRLYRVGGSPGIGASAIGPDWFEVTATRPGMRLVRIHWTPYWTVTGGDACIRRDDDWTGIEIRRPGTVRVSARFSVDGALRRDRECSA
jgi:hypothetical protein